MQQLCIYLYICSTYVCMYSYPIPASYIVWKIIKNHFLDVMKLNGAHTIVIIMPATKQYIMANISHKEKTHARILYINGRCCLLLRLLVLARCLCVVGFYYIWPAELKYTYAKLNCMRICSIRAQSACTIYVGTIAIREHVPKCKG